jgi:uncharacterized membrane protein
LSIVLMALVTYGTRVGGYWIMGRVTLSPQVAAVLVYLPGAVLTSLIVPAVLKKGVEGVVALGVTALAMCRWGNLFIVMLAGVGTIRVLRLVL